MKNYVFLAAGLLVVLGICLAVIHYEAEETRQAMRDTAQTVVQDGILGAIKRTNPRQAGDDAVDTIQSILNPENDEAAATVPEIVKPAVEAAREVVQGVNGVVMGSRPAPHPPTSATVRPGTTSPAGTRPPVRKTGPRNVIEEIEATMDEILGADANPAPSGTAAKSSAAGKTEAKPKPTVVKIDPNDPVASILEIARRAAASTEDYAQSVVRLTPAEERAWGKKLHAEVLVESKVVRDPEITRRVQRVAAPLLDRLLRAEIPYTFTVLQTAGDDLNAFSLPGGYVYLNSALLDYVHNDEELQFVLAHEIAHVDLEHCSRKLTFAARAGDLATPAIGGFVRLLHNFMSRPYAKDEEFVADERALRDCLAVGQTREQALAFPRRFGSDPRTRRDEPRSPRESSVFSEIFRTAGAHFDTHPPMDERVARLEAVQVN